MEPPLEFVRFHPILFTCSSLKMGNYVWAKNSNGGTLRVPRYWMIWTSQLALIQIL